MEESNDMHRFEWTKESAKQRCCGEIDSLFKLFCDAARSTSDSTVAPQPSIIAVKEKLFQNNIDANSSAKWEKITKTIDEFKVILCQNIDSVFCLIRTQLEEQTPCEGQPLEQNIVTPNETLKLVSSSRSNIPLHPSNENLPVQLPTNPQNDNLELSTSFSTIIKPEILDAPIQQHNDSLQIETQSVPSYSTTNKADQLDPNHSTNSQLDPNSNQFELLSSDSHQLISNIKAEIPDENNLPCTNQNDSNCKCVPCSFSNEKFVQHTDSGNDIREETLIDDFGNTPILPCFIDSSLPDSSALTNEEQTESNVLPPIESQPDENVSASEQPHQLISPNHCSSNRIEPSDSSPPPNDYTLSTKQSNLANNAFTQKDHVENDQQKISSVELEQAQLVTSECGQANQPKQLTYQTLVDEIAYGGRAYTTTCFICTHKDCNERLPDKNTLAMHRFLVHQLLRFECYQDGCEKSFRQKSELDDHIKGEHSELSCPKCTSKFKQHKELDLHIQFKHIQGEFKCRHCPFVTNIRQLSLYHFAYYHLTGSEKPEEIDYSQQVHEYITAKGQILLSQCTYDVTENSNLCLNRSMPEQEQVASKVGQDGCDPLKSYLPIGPNPSKNVACQSKAITPEDSANSSTVFDQSVNSHQSWANLSKKQQSTLNLFAEKLPERNAYIDPRTSSFYAGKFELVSSTNIPANQPVRIMGFSENDNVQVELVTNSLRSSRVDLNESILHNGDVDLRVILNQRQIMRKRVYSQDNCDTSHDKNVSITLRINCPHCDAELSNMRQFKVHLKKEHSTLPFKCFAKRCKQTFINKHEQNKHVQKCHSSITWWKCPKCPFRSRSSSVEGHLELDKHYFLRHMEGNFQCIDCEFTANYRMDVCVHHEKNHRTLTYGEAVKVQSQADPSKRIRHSNVTGAPMPNTGV